MRRLVLAMVLLLSGVAADGQVAPDAVATTPGSYTQQFENDWVRIVRVHYAPHAKLPAHAHPARASAYVYLNDSGPVVFRHIGSDLGSPTRPPTKAGAFRLSRGVEEVHEVENLSSLPSDFLRVEFKTDPKEPRTLRGKFFREAGPSNASPAGANQAGAILEAITSEKVQFENAQVRVTRLVIPAGQQLELRTTPQEPALLVALTQGSIASSGSPKHTGSIAPGRERWININTSQRLHNSGADPVELLRFDFKTAPLGVRSQF